MMEPFRIKSVEAIHMTTRQERVEILKKADYNLFKVAAEQVIIDLLTDSGTGAMSQNQWAAMMSADETYACAASYNRFENAVKNITRYKYVIPVHQGRAAERILGKILISKKVVTYSNSFFDTTKANFQVAGAETIDLPCEYSKTNKFNGNMDVKKLEGHLSNQNSKTAIVVMTVTNNAVGGQPVSMQNVREAAAICRKYKALFYMDACRYAENTWFIKTLEEPNSERKPLDIARELFSYFDIAVMSTKKDGLSNTGGFISLKNDKDLYDTIAQELILTEGYITYGGMTGRDMDAAAVGLYEALESDYLKYRINSLQEFGNILMKAGVPIIEPTGGHGIYVDAAKVFPDMPANEYPAWTLMCALYLEGGIRGTEIGHMMMGVTADGHKTEWDKELLRLAVPRRMYTMTQLKYVGEIFEKVMAKRHLIKGMKIVEASTTLRHFTAKMCPIDKKYFESIN